VCNYKEDQKKKPINKDDKKINKTISLQFKSHCYLSNNVINIEYIIYFKLV